ncbi:MAG: NifB/NifX family molybdenum-iron cluster-binding protein [Desulfomicrobium sp.]|jgi:predicted Fe-Mo cluster-binding NifX family protein|nr:NifB/NifX family molybdenum-iron cluster-binding protein [Desulfomicrobium sp.]NLV97441.1 dinitrogenase iron-molybdenum cofactor biosynthesis protein [Desulfovibrionales bacterium]
MEHRILITVAQDEIAPRFDLTTEVLLVTLSENDDLIARKSFLLAHASGDELCDLALSRDMGVIVCGAIEDEYYHYLRWKRIEVIDSVMGPVEEVISCLVQGKLKTGDILYQRTREKE